MSRIVPFILLLLTLAIVLGARIAGPSDLHDKSQPKTVAYTADMALHGRFILPRDMVGGPARKPPMYNWIGVPFVALFGFSEPMLKMPAILGGIATVASAHPPARHATSGMSGRARYANFMIG